MDDAIQDEVLQIISRIAGTKKPILLSASINHSLPIDGDDAFELLETIQKKFKTNFTDLDFHRYFHDEGEFMIFSSWFRKNKKDSLTVQHLVDVVKKGTWFD